VRPIEVLEENDLGNFVDDLFQFGFVQTQLLFRALPAVSIGIVGRTS